MNDRDTLTLSQPRRVQPGRPYKSPFNKGKPAKRVGPKGHQAMLEQCKLEKLKVQMVIGNDETLFEGIVVDADAYSITFTDADGTLGTVFKHAVRYIAWPAQVKVPA